MDYLRRLGIGYNYHIKIFNGAPINWRDVRERDPRARAVQAAAVLADQVQAAVLVAAVHQGDQVQADQVLVNQVLARRVLVHQGDPAQQKDQARAAHPREKLARLAHQKDKRESVQL